MSKWPRVRLDTVAAIRSSRRVLKNDWRSEGVPFYRGREVTSLSTLGKVDPDLFIDVSLYEELRASSGVPAVGDLLVTAIGTIGNAFVIDSDAPFYFKDASVLWLSPQDALDSRYCGHWFKSDDFRDQVSRGNGATVDTLTLDALRSMTIPFPPLDEQKRIVAKLDEVSHFMRSLGKIHQERLQALEPLFIKLIDESLERLPREISHQPLGSVAGLVRGPFGGSLKKSMFVASGFAVYEQQHAISGDVQSHRYFISEEKYNSMHRFAVAEDDLLMSCSGTIGKIARIHATSPPGVINQALLKVTPSPLMRSEFLARMMQGSRFQEFVRGGAAGSAMQNVAAMSEIRGFSVPIPSLETQDSIIHKLKKAETEIAHLRNNRQRRESDEFLMASRIQFNILCGAA